MLAAVVVAIGGVTAASTALVASRRSAPVVSLCSTLPAPGGVAFELTPDQARNAAVIAAVAAKLGLPDHAVTVALATALQESRLLDLPYGDLDSVGLFQQRPSQGWGAPSQLLDPVYASTAFYGRLMQVSGWQTMPVAAAAQAVQHSAAPSAYAAWDSEARTLATALTGETPAGFGCQLAAYTGAPPAPGAFTGAQVDDLGAALVGRPVSVQTGWRVASWAVGMAWPFHLTRVSFAGWTWTPVGGRWRRTAGRAGSAGEVAVTAG